MEDIKYTIKGDTFNGKAKKGGFRILIKKE